MKELEEVIRLLLKAQREKSKSYGELSEEYRHTVESLLGLSREGSKERTNDSLRRAVYKEKRILNDVLNDVGQGDVASTESHTKRLQTNQARISRIVNEIVNKESTSADRKEYLKSVLKDLDTDTQELIPQAKGAASKSKVSLSLLQARYSCMDTDLPSRNPMKRIS